MSVRKIIPAQYFFLVLLLMLMLLCGTRAHAAETAQSGGQLFTQYCETCHTIGGGKLVGPDLKGVTQRRSKEWLMKFISNPAQMTKTDPTAKQLLAEYGVLMPTFRLSQEQITALIAYLGSASGGAGKAPAKGEMQAPAQKTAEGDSSQGRAYFAGVIRFKNGGPQCISCHSVSGVGLLGGGTLGPDLTNVYSKYKAGLNAFLATLSFPVMRPIYHGHQLTPQEQSDLAAFFENSAKEKPKSMSMRVRGIALVIFIILILIFAFAWRNRLRGVRKPFVTSHEGKDA